MPSERRRPRTAGAVVVALLALGIAGCGEGVPAIDTSDAEAALATLDRTAPGPDCTIVDGDLLLERAFREADDPTVDRALGGFVYVEHRGVATGGAAVECGRRDETTGATVSLVVSDAPGDGVIEPDDTELTDEELDAQRDALAEAYAASLSTNASPTSVDQRIDTRGGTIYHVCATHSEPPADDVCAAAWFSGDLVVAATVTGSAAAEVDLAAVDEPLRRLLQLVVDGLDDGAAG